MRNQTKNSHDSESLNKELQMQPHGIPTMLTVNQTAEALNLARHFIRQLVLQDKIKHVRAGKKILINFQGVVEYLNTGGKVGQHE